MITTGCGSWRIPVQPSVMGSLPSLADGGDRSDFTEPCRICGTQRLPPKTPNTADEGEDGQRKHGEGESQRPTGICPRPVTHANRGLPRSAEGRVCHAYFISMAHLRGRLALYAAAWVRCLSTALMGMRNGWHRNRHGVFTYLCVGVLLAAPRAPARPPRVFGFCAGSRRALRGIRAHGGEDPLCAFLFSCVSMHISVRVYS
jgi:hypothetical protein